MATTETYHALVLNYHQPAGNLESLLASTPWEVEQILYAMDRAPRSLWGYEDVARVHVSLSGTLLETLASPDFQAAVYGWVDCGSLLWYFQNQLVFDVLGTGYYHPVLPLIPPADREEQMMRWRGIGRHLMWREYFGGFWPPEMGFCMEMIPMLKRLGYRYVFVDSENVTAVTPMSWQELRYRPHIARHGGEEIIVIVRDRELSNAQESGMDAEWFTAEVQARTQGVDFAPLVTTATDGDKGSWFRNVQPATTFWGSFYQPLLNAVRAGSSPVRPTFVGDYLDRYGAHGEVWVNTAAWNTGDHDGRGFEQWTSSKAQKEALNRVGLTSAAIHGARRLAMERKPHDADVHREIEESLWRCLRAETSCNFFWGDAWVSRCHEDLDRAWAHLHTARARIPG